MAARTVRSDSDIQRNVLEELKWEARVQPNEIGVVVKDGIVSLTGWVDSYAKKWAAERTVHRLRGVRAVANDIEVRLPGTFERTDSEIARTATQALEWDAFVPAEKIEVTAANGWVMLRGEVEWGYQKRAAEHALRRLAGVRGVTNLVAVRPGVRPSPEELKQEIHNALVRSAKMDAGRISVDVEGETVVLAGTVRSWMEREEAERMAWSAPGVSAVDDQLTVAV
jgi:osmotically-inducible protein OsmY